MAPRARLVLYMEYFKPITTSKLLSIINEAKNQGYTIIISATGPDMAVFEASPILKHEAKMDWRIGVVYVYTTLGGYSRSGL